jgi:leader peptidase (prepilin peptidase)/N-methyltransferase
LEHAIYIVFLFAIGACVGSFLNVVVWRLPRGESIVSPPSQCPKCGKNLKWYDNLPVVGWLKLGGKCRFCGQPISIRYPIVEAVTGALFAGYYVCFFMLGVGPCPRVPTGAWGQPVFATLPMHWAVYVLYMGLICVLLAASLIDAELYIIPLELLWVIGGVGLIVHAIIDTSRTPGTLNASPVAAALAAGGAVGLLISIGLLRIKVFKHSFADGGPLLEVDREAYEKEREAAKNEGRELEFDAPEYTPAQVRAEIRHEMLFLLPPLVLAALCAALVMSVGVVGLMWNQLLSNDWLSGLLGSVFGALIGGFVVWLTRVLGTLAFGREAMGMGDVHLMAAVGAVVGAGAATVALFLAPFFGLVLAVYLLATGTKRELPYGPYLSLATAFVMLFYCPIAAWLAPGMAGLRFVVGRLFGLDAGV